MLLMEPYEAEARIPDGKFTRRKILIGEYKTLPDDVRTSTSGMCYLGLTSVTPMDGIPGPGTV